MQHKKASHNNDCTPPSFTDDYLRGKYIHNEYSFGVIWFICYMHYCQLLFSMARAKLKSESIISSRLFHYLGNCLAQPFYPFFNCWLINTRKIKTEGVYISFFCIKWIAGHKCNIFLNTNIEQLHCRY